MQKYVKIFIVLIIGSLFGSDNEKIVMVCLADLVNPNKEGITSVVKPIMRDEINVVKEIRCHFVKNCQKSIKFKKVLKKE
ncbi:MAG: hypothetical protein ACXWL5_04470 [Candidatus Chromulinivorax sp.]